MANTWATSGVDLHLILTGRKIRAGLEEALREGVRTGQLGPGMRLPSSRSLAHDLGISRNTVAEAYGQLVAEGWLTATRGSSTQVALRTSTGEKIIPHASAQEVIRIRYDLRPGSPDLSAFPRSGWLAATRQVFNSAPNEALGYSDARGRPEVRQALSEYLSRSRGVHIKPSRIVVCSGFVQGLALICQVLQERGVRSLAVEAYGQPSYRKVAITHGLGIVNLSVDGLGARIDKIGDSKAMLLTPAHQFPIGVALGPTRRSQAIEWARETGGIIIEDDYDGEFRYDRQPLGAMQALSPEHVIYVGSASKSLAPGLRLGWLVLPTSLVDEVVDAKTLADRQGSVIDQLTLAEFINSGAYDRYVRKSRLAYRHRRDKLIATLAARAPRVCITGIAAGLHVVLDLPQECDEAKIIARAARTGLALEGLSSYSAPGQEPRPALVVGYGTPSAHAFTGAIDLLCEVLGG